MLYFLTAAWIDLIQIPSVILSQETVTKRSEMWARFAYIAEVFHHTTHLRPAHSPTPPFRVRTHASLHLTAHFSYLVALTYLDPLEV